MAFVRLLSETGQKQRNALMKNLEDDQVEVLRQITRNVLEGRLVLSARAIKDLKRFENGFIRFADSKGARRKKRLCQNLKTVWPRLIKAVLPQLELL